MSVHTKLMQARIKLQGTKLNKSGQNTFAKYRYFELGDFLPAIQTIFFDIGLCGVISYQPDIATLTITDTETHESIVIASPMSSAALKGCHEVQNLGAVQTYIRRYLWVTAMEIVEHDALDASPPKDDEDIKWAEKQAAPIRAMVAKGDLAGAAHHLNTLGLGNTYDGEAKESVWAVLDSPTRSAIKAYEAISQAVSLEALKAAWEASPKRALNKLQDAKDKRKEELSQPEKEAA